jgi:hypothetical protein
MEARAPIMGEGVAGVLRRETHIEGAGVFGKVVIRNVGWWIWIGGRSRHHDNAWFWLCR